MFLTLQVLHDPQDNFNYLLYNILIIQCKKTATHQAIGSFRLTLKFVW